MTHAEVAAETTRIQMRLCEVQRTLEDLVERAAEAGVQAGEAEELLENFMFMELPPL